MTKDQIMHQITALKHPLIYVAEKVVALCEIPLRHTVPSVLSAPIMGQFRPARIEQRHTN